MCGLGLTWYVLEHFHLLSGACELKAGLIAGASLLDGVKLYLEMFKLNAEVSIFSVKVTVVVYLAGEPPVVMGKKGVVQNLEVSSRAHHEKAEPCWDGECRFCFSLIIKLVVRFRK